VFFTRGEPHSVQGSARFFCVTRGGGLLLRLQEADQERFAQKGNIGRNAGLPAWLGPVGDELAEGAPDDPVQVQGDPREWVWMHVEDEQVFNKRKPIVHEAMAYARHLLAIAAEG
ncbi:MAG: hypothetical protein KY455_13945, partial [Euryarchaeota archaeon]|nr:hypothetical protein [Euryarchaeota archaeon]